MKTLVGTLLALSIFVGVALALDSQYKTRLITSATLTIHVKDGQYIVIRNFTQDRDVGQRRAVISAAVLSQTPAPAPTTAPTPSPTPTSSPDLTATKTDDVDRHVAFPDPWHWTIRVANSGNTPATFLSGQNILTDNLPSSNITYSQPSVTNQMNIVANPGAISCVISGSNDLSCTAINNVIINSGGSFDVSFTATPTAAGTYANPRASGDCKVDPAGLVTESIENNNTCADTVVSIAPINAVILTAALLNPVAILNPPKPTGESIKPIIVAGPATLTIPPIPGATLSITYRKYLQPIQPTASPTSTVTAAKSSTSSTFSTKTSTTTHSGTVSKSIVSDEDEIEWSTPSRTPTPTATPTPTPPPKSRASTATPTPTATPPVSPTPTP